MFNKADRPSRDIHAMYVTMTMVLFKVNIQVLLIIILIKSKFLSNYLFIFTTQFLHLFLLKTFIILSKTSRTPGWIKRLSTISRPKLS